MIIIAHRGNTEGSRPEYENKPDYILSALRLGFNVEVDVWCEGGELYLGHDEPETLISAEFLSDDRFWCHAKNVEAFHELHKLGIHCFFIDNDSMTVTSRGIPYVYASFPTTKHSVIIMPEWGGHWPRTEVYGIVTDYAIDSYRYIKAAVENDIHFLIKPDCT